MNLVLYLVHAELLVVFEADSTVTSVYGDITAVVLEIYFSTFD